MKTFLSFGIVCLAAVTLISCKKSTDSVNPTEELKGSVWAGEFKITSATYTGLQPGSLVLNADGSFTWYDISGSIPGTWIAEGNKVTLNYSNNTSVIADISKDSWSNFSTTINKSFQIVNLSRTAVPKPEELTVSYWTGKYSSASEMNLTFIPGQKLTTFGFTQPYSIAGAGVRYSRTPTGFLVTSYAVFINSTSMKGCDLVSISSANQYILWEGKKQ